MRFFEASTDWVLLVVLDQSVPTCRYDNPWQAAQAWRQAKTLVESVQWHPETGQCPEFLREVRWPRAH